jgi:hypothetical protein
MSVFLYRAIIAGYLRLAAKKAKFLSFLSVRGTLLMQRRQLLLSGRKSSGVNEIESKSAIFTDGNVITFNRSESGLFRLGETAG